MRQQPRRTVEDSERELRHGAQLRGAGHQRIAQFAGVGGRRGAVRRGDNPPQRLLGHGHVGQRPIRAACPDQQFDRIGRRQRRAVERMDCPGREELMVDGRRGADRHAVAAADAAVWPLHRNRHTGLLLLQNLEGADPHAAAAPDALVTNLNSHCRRLFYRTSPTVFGSCR